MSAILVFLLYTAQIVLCSVLLPRACNADNCARAITGTRKGSAFTSQAKADCSSFMLATITPVTT